MTKKSDERTTDKVEIAWVTVSVVGVIHHRIAFWHTRCWVLAHCRVCSPGKIQGCAPNVWPLKKWKHLGKTVPKFGREMGAVSLTKCDGGLVPVWLWWVTPKTTRGRRYFYRSWSCILSFGAILRPTPTTPSVTIHSTTGTLVISTRVGIDALFIRVAIATSRRASTARFVARPTTPFRFWVPIALGRLARTRRYSQNSLTRLSIRFFLVRQRPIISL